LSSPDTILLVKARAGLGNRLLALMPALAWADRYQIPVCIHWRDGMYAPRGECGFTPMFSLKNVEQIDFSSLDRSLPAHPEVHSGRLDMHAFHLAKELDPKHRANSPLNQKFGHRKLAVDLGEPPHRGINVFVAYQDIWRGRGFVRRAFGVDLPKDRMSFLRACFSRYLDVNQEIVGPVTEYCAKESAGKRSISVHFRNTDRAGKIELHFRALDRMLHDAGDAVIFLATDSEASVAKFQNRYGDAIRQLPKSFAEDGKAIHVASSESDKDRMAAEALKDVWLLRCGDELVYQGESTFGQIAQAMRPEPHRRVVNVSKNRPGYILRQIAWRARC
jgi:hypothetical protein